MHTHTDRHKHIQTRVSPHVGSKKVGIQAYRQTYTGRLIKAKATDLRTTFI